MQRTLFVTAVCLAILLGGCGTSNRQLGQQASQSNQQAGQSGLSALQESAAEGKQPAGTGALSAAPQLPQPALTLAQKQQHIAAVFGHSLVAHRGMSYDPKKPYRVDGRLIVNYVNGLTVPGVNANRQKIAAGTRTIVLPGGVQSDASTVVPTQISPTFASAAPKPESLNPSARMRLNGQYVGISRFLADRYKIRLERELYYGCSNWGVFVVDESRQNAATLASRIQSENNDFVYQVEPDMLALPAGHYPRALDPQMDDIAPIGTDVETATNGPDFWDYGEGYAYFQAKVHRAHGCWMAPFWPFDEHAMGPGMLCKIFVADSGIYPHHEEFVPGRIIQPTDPLSYDHAYWDCSGDGDKTMNDGDTSGWHGTSVCGLLGAERRSGRGIIGVIPLGQVLPFKVTGESLPFDPPASSYSIMATAWIRAYDVRDIYRCTTLNMSYGGYSPVQPQIFESALQIFASDSNGARFMITASAGNQDDPAMYVDSGVTYGQYPAALAETSANPDHIVSVMALNKDEEKSDFSNYATLAFPDSVTVSGPGGNGGGGSTTPKGPDPNSYGDFNGTSMAAPYVGGILSLLHGMVEQGSTPSLTAAVAKAHLVATARSDDWDGNPLWDGVTDPIIKPCADCDHCISWLDMTSPEWNPATTPPVVSGLTTIQTTIRPTVGPTINHSGASYYVEVQMFKTDGTGVWTVGTQTTSAAGPDGSILSSITFDLDSTTYRAVSGEVYFVAEVTFPSGPFAVTVPQHAIIQHPGDDWNKKPVATLASGSYVEQIALGHNGGNGLVAWLEGNGATRDLWLGKQGPSGYTAVKVETYNTASPVRIWDLSIGYNGGQYGVSYRRKDDYDANPISPPTVRAYFAPGAIGVGDPLSDPFLLDDTPAFPVSWSSLRVNVDTDYSYSLRNYSNLYYWFSTRNSVDGWTEHRYNPSSGGGSMIGMSLTPYYGTYGSYPRALITRAGTGTTNPLFWHCEVNGLTGANETLVPQRAGLLPDRWLGESLFPGQCGPDPGVTPVVFTSSGNQYVDAALGDYSTAGFTISSPAVEVIGTGPEAVPLSQGLNGDSENRDVDPDDGSYEALLAFISGEQMNFGPELPGGAMTGTTERADLKLASRNLTWSPSGYTWTGSSWNLRVIDTQPVVEVLTPVRGSQLATDLITDKLNAAYVRWVPSGATFVKQVVVATEP